MNIFIKFFRLLPFVLLTGFILRSSSAHAESFSWIEHRPGLWIAEVPPPPTPQNEAPAISMVIARIDPDILELKLLTSSESGLPPMPIRVWAERFGLLAGINASMYQEDYRTSTGHMKNFQHLNNPGINARFGAFLAFHPLDPGRQTKTLIIDRARDQWVDLIQQYQTIIQNYRIIAKPRGVVWLQESTPAPIACVARDQRGHILFIHSRAAYSVREFGEMLLALPLGIEDALYVEGGGPASLYIREAGPGKKPPLPAGFSQMVNEFSPLPNVIGVVPIPSKR